ncbi:sigma-54-dependent Fis family transcriptional regulator [Bacillus dakarensis]|uniref:sigma-54-dependent Fis family transcriptional regulator n=1 Tax=Robertmurraya dakarensis TaxID=1926278 RepID=UPI000980A3F0|nr:sigma-54-dependent Fis family transcriptional regulator [Bacillus dakarensis]
MQKEIWSQFTLEGTMNINLRREILESWNKCKQIGISFDTEKVTSHISKDALNKKRQRNHDLINAASQVMRDFIKDLNGEGYLLVLADAEGYLIEMLGDNPSMKVAEQSGIKEGARWLEEDVGTTGLSLALKSKTAIATSGKEHYCSVFRDWDCSACPIFVDGVFLGAFDVCRLGARNNLIELLALAVAGARTISERYQLNKLYMKEKMLSHVLTKYVPNLGILALDTQGTELYKNKVADDFLKLFDENFGSLGLNEKNVLSDFDKDLLFTELEVNKKHFSIRTEEIISQGKKLATLKLIHPQTKEIIATSKGKHDLFNLNTKNIAFQKTLQKAIKVSKSDASILILGESGVGKDFMARFIHKQSKRRDHPFTAINCAALPRELITSELFGYEGGAFTGAKHKGNKGKIEATDKGTVFLDEIADLPLDLQATLLRSLEEKQVVRVGGTTPIPVNVRFLAATNKNLEELVEEGKFREDLYYRLKIFTIKIPSLRERIEDFEVILNTMLSEACEKVQRQSISFTSCAMKIFKEHSWPGNLRELRSVIERIIYLHDEEYLDSFHAQEFLEVEQAYQNTSEREFISDILRKTNGNRSKAAKELGISRSALYRKMQKYNLE